MPSERNGLLIDVKDGRKPDRRASLVTPQEFFSQVKGAGICYHAVLDGLVTVNPWDLEKCPVSEFSLIQKRKREGEEEKKGEGERERDARPFPLNLRKLLVTIVSSV